MNVSMRCLPEMRHQSQRWALAHHRHESGVALVVGLVLLVAMTMLGVATLSGTRLNEQRTSNSQQKALAFEVAESAIASVWDAQYLSEVLVSDPSNSGNDPAPIASIGNDGGIKSDFNQLVNGKGVAFDGGLTVQYCGETAPTASDLNADQSSTQMVAMLVDVNSVATVENTRTRADHVQRGAITSVKTDRTGNCPAP